MNLSNPTVLTGQHVIEAAASAVQFVDLIHICYTYEHTEEHPILEDSTAAFIKHECIPDHFGREATNTILAWNGYYPHILKKNVSLDKSRCIPCWDTGTFLESNITYIITDAIETVTYEASAFDDDDHNDLVKIVSDILSEAYKVLYFESSGSNKAEIIFNHTYFNSRINLVNAVRRLIELHKANKDIKEFEVVTYG